MNNRYDFVFIFDAQDANPNGDPDAGNLPRIDAETSQGLVTDVCLKRKVRNFIEQTTSNNIYFKEFAVHNHQHEEAYKALLEKGEIEDDEATKEKMKKPKMDIKEKAKAWMCLNFYDIRTFGAVMSTDVNCGQVRGPVQISFARSIDPIVASEHAITRTSVTDEKDIEKERTMGRKFTVPYGLYRCHGFINPFLADQTGFSEEGDLELFFQALENAFQFDQSAARPAGSMAPRALLIFRHDGTDTDETQRAKQAKLGCAPSHALFDRLKIESFEERPSEDGKPPRKFADYASRITFDGKPLDEVVAPPNGKPSEVALGNGVTLIRRI